MVHSLTSPQRAKGWSAPATTRRVLGLLAHLDWRTARVADVGAGRGHLSMLLGEMLRANGIEPAAHVFPCDLIPASYGRTAVLRAIKPTVEPHG